MKTLTDSFCSLAFPVDSSVIKGVIASKRPYLDGTIVDPTGQWSGRKPEIFMSASVIWGLVAPARFFSGLYHPLVSCLVMPVHSRVSLTRAPDICSTG